MGNLALHSVEESDNLRATTGTVEVPTKSDDAVTCCARARSQTYSTARAYGTSHTICELTFYVMRV